MTRQEEVQAALDAWEDWKVKKVKSDQSASFADCHDTAQAWVRFQNLYLGQGKQIATCPAPTAIIFRPNFGGAA
ncbi:hypothetical protein [Mesorhizobium marinum]|uniref:Uncharacterized protein n=1 Tax=Mesorhizobium marinum TaxID=3228790 RepID=A0ABV3R5H6_9HYPH